MSRPVPVVEIDTDNKTSSKDQSKEVKDLSFLTPKNTSITTKFLERSGSILSASKAAQITQNKEVLIKLESDFANFKIETESKLSSSVFVENQVFLDKVNSIIQSQKLENKNLHSKIYDLEVSKELLTNKVKTLEDQNKHQFRQIGKLEGQINTLTTLVTNLFKSNMLSEPNTCSEDDEVVGNIPTNNKFNPLIKEPTANIDRKVDHISPEKDQKSMQSSIQIQQPTRNQQDYHQMH